MSLLPMPGRRQVKFPQAVYGAALMGHQSARWGEIALPQPSHAEGASLEAQTANGTRDAPTVSSKRNLVVYSGLAV